MEFSPSIGPKTAQIVIIDDSPLSGPMAIRSERLLNQALVHAGVDRGQCYMTYCVPKRAPGDRFESHSQNDKDLGLARLKSELAGLRNAKVLLTLGPNSTEWVLGGKPPVAQRGEGKREGFISSWRGSIIPLWQLDPNETQRLAPENYLQQVGLPNALKLQAVVIPTYHPSAVVKQFNWHPWFLLDIDKAGSIVKNGLTPTKYRKWYRNDSLALKRLAESDVDLISVDSEMSPWIVGLATDEEVHVFEFEESFRHSLTKLMKNPKIVKIAHRWLHDHAFFRKCLDIPVVAPLFDVLGGLQNLNSALQKELSPHLATKFTNWPYHKWLTNIDQLLYCGMDSVVAYDAYWPMMTQLIDKGMYVGASIGEMPDSLTAHDHKLLMPLLAMQAKGFKIDEKVRGEVAGELKAELAKQELELDSLVQPVIAKRIDAFHKPHLFRIDRKCTCCGGGKSQCQHCDACNTGHPERDYKENVRLIAELNGITQKAVIASWVPCVTCKGTGKVEKKLDFNPDSPDQLADVIYRGLRITPRRFKGNETVKAAQLNPIKDKHPIVAKVVETSELRAEYDTVDRLSAGQDGLLHCEFDPWGAETRVASKEGLLEAGTNAQNLPKKARRFVVPRSGYTFIYPDMAQVEARAYCVLSGDKNLRKALYEVLPDLGKPDYHTWLLRAIHDYDATINLSRDQSKRVSYAGFFGVRPEQLAKELSAEAFRKKLGMQVDSKQALVILETLNRICPEIKRSQTAMCDEVLRTRRLKNPFTGREFPFIGYIVDKKKPGELDYEIKKQVFSRLPQDMAAWVLGLGLIDMFYTSNEWGKLITPLIHVHDALLIEVPIAKLQEAEALALRCMNRYLWGMDWIAESKKGTNWYECS